MNFFKCCLKNPSCEIESAALHVPIGLQKNEPLLSLISYWTGESQAIWDWQAQGRSKNTASSLLLMENKSPWFCVTTADSVFPTQDFTLEVWVEFKVSLSYFLMNVCLLPPWVNASADMAYMPCTELTDSREVKRMLSWANNWCTRFP